MYFAEGVVEDIIERNSSFTSKGRAGDVKHWGGNSACYVLEANVLNQVRITGSY